MTEYIPKVGDRVTVAGDDHEWEVRYIWSGRVEVEALVNGTYWPLTVLPSMLTPVPTPPPEPPLFTDEDVERVHGCYICDPEGAARHPDDSEWQEGCASCHQDYLNGYFLPPADEVHP